MQRKVGLVVSGGGKRKEREFWEQKRERKGWPGQWQRVRERP